MDELLEPKFDQVKYFLFILKIKIEKKKKIFYFIKI